MLRIAFEVLPVRQLQLVHARRVCTACNTVLVLPYQPMFTAFLLPQALLRRLEDESPSAEAAAAAALLAA